MKIILLCGAVLAITAFGFSNRNLRPSVQLNVKDLPHNGLHIIVSSDPSYAGMAATQAVGSRLSAFESLSPYSVFLKNETEKTIVACQLKWDLVAPSGEVETETTGFITLWRLMNQGASGIGGETVEPKSAKLFFPSNVANAVIDSLSRADGRTNSSVNLLRAAHLDELATELSQSASITVSIDGVFFDDGTFVGSDSTHFFDYVVSLRDARIDLFREMEREALQDGNVGRAFETAKHLVGASETKLRPNSTPTELYSFHKKKVAEEVLQMKQKAGEEKTLKFFTQYLRTPTINLKKVSVSPDTKPHKR